MFKKEEKLFKAYCDTNRLSIIKLISDNKNKTCDGDKGICACKILEKLNISQSTLSHHMKILIEAGVVIGEKQGRWVHYSLASCEIKRSIDFLSSFLDKEEL